MEAQKRKVLTTRMLETQVQRHRIGYKPVDYHLQAWSTVQHTDGVYILTTVGLRVKVKQHRTGLEVQEIHMDSSFDIDGKLTVTGEVRVIE